MRRSRPSDSRGPVLLALGAWLLAAAAAAQPASVDTLTREEKEVFLQSARVVRSRALSKGITRPVRLTLADGRLTHDAVFSSVDERVPIARFKTGRTELDFVDSYQYSIAAYRLAVLLGLDDMVPVTVERRWDGRPGALSWWIDAKWDEQERIQQRKRPPELLSWTRQMSRMWVFTELLADADRNQSNVLITEDWRVWMIDFTRAFRRTRELPHPDRLKRVDRTLLTRLRELTEEQVTAALHPYVGGAEIEQLIAQRGEAVVLLD